MVFETAEFQNWVQELSNYKFLCKGKNYIDCSIIFVYGYKTRTPILAGSEVLFSFLFVVESAWIMQMKKQKLMVR